MDWRFTCMHGGLGGCCTQRWKADSDGAVLLHCLDEVLFLVSVQVEHLHGIVVERSSEQRNTQVKPSRTCRFRAFDNEAYVLSLLRLGHTSTILVIPLMCRFLTALNPSS